MRNWVSAAITALLVGGAVSAHGQGSARPPDEAARAAVITQPTNDFTKPERFESDQGGAATSHHPTGASSFSHSSTNMSFDRQGAFKAGDEIFRKLWVAASPMSRESDGLGPLFNARSCQSCHLKDGRGAPPEGDEQAVSMVLRLSVPPVSEAETAARVQRRVAIIGEPTYGKQLQNFSIGGVTAEGRMTVSYRDRAVTLGDGTAVMLRRPVYRAVDLAYGPMRSGTLMSPRVTPPMIGVGLLEVVSDADILALASTGMADPDGVSGRPNRVWSAARGKVMLGRFGWKAGQPSLADQLAGAFSGDMGLSSSFVAESWGECTAVQSDCRGVLDGADPGDAVEVSRATFDGTLFYSRNLAVPARRDISGPEVLKGKRLFSEARCIACHNPKFVTRRDSAEPEQSFQLIWPYSDLLLHDMGEGLADHRPEGDASGREWRTAPLWGIGLTKTVSGHTFFLHDGRARDLTEAILWHGGEAERSTARFKAMRKADRDALIAFLNSL